MANARVGRRKRQPPHRIGHQAIPIIRTYSTVIHPMLIRPMLIWHRGTFDKISVAQVIVSDRAATITPSTIDSDGSHAMTRIFRKPRTVMPSTSGLTRTVKALAQGVIVPKW